MNQKFKEVSLTIFFIVSFLLIWQWSAINEVIKKEYFSFPSDIATDFISYYQTGEMIVNLLATLQEAFVGLLIGTMAGVSIALLLSFSKLFSNVFEPIITMANSVPQMALAPIYIMWFGIGPASKIFMAALLVFFIVFFSTFGGIKNSEKKYREAAQLLGANEKIILFKITLPNIVPWIISGVRAGIGAALIGAIVGEYLGATKGIGWSISFATSYFNMARVMSNLILLLILGFVFNKALTIIEKKLMNYRER